MANISFEKVSLAENMGRNDDLVVNVQCGFNPEAVTHNASNVHLYWSISLELKLKGLDGALVIPTSPVSLDDLKVDLPSYRPTLNLKVVAERIATALSNGMVRLEVREADKAPRMIGFTMSYLPAEERIYPKYEEIRGFASLWDLRGLVMLKQRQAKVRSQLEILPIKSG